MKLRVHGVRMGVLTGLIPKEKIIQGVLFRTDNIHGKSGNFWFELKVDFLNEKVEVLPKPKPQDRFFDIFDVKFPYAETEKDKVFCKQMIEKETNWLAALRFLDDAFQGLYAFVTRDGSYQISLSFEAE